MNTAICSAIRAQRVLSFVYKGQPRTVEPHCHGRSRKGKEVLRAFQTSGGGGKDSSGGWKLFEVQVMSQLLETGATFSGPRPGYDADDAHMDSVHCAL